MKVEKVIKNVSVRTLLEWFDDNKLVFDPVYQRESNVWGLKRKQNFVFTLVNNKRYVIPAIYFNEKASGLFSSRFDIVDGKQRITTIIEFIRGIILMGKDWQHVIAPLKVPAIPAELLVDAPHLEQYQNKTYDKLPKELQDLVLDAELTVILFQNYEDATMRNIFGFLQEGVPLNPQEKLKSVDSQFNTISLKLETDYMRMFNRVKPNHKRGYWYNVITHLLAVTLDPGIRTTFGAIKELMSNLDGQKRLDEAGESVDGFLDFIRGVVTFYSLGQPIVNYFNEVQLIGLYTLWRRNILADVDALTFYRAWGSFMSNKSDSYKYESHHSTNNRSNREYRADMISKYLAEIGVIKA